MNCFKCNAPFTTVSSTDPTAGDKVGRWRKCVECGARFDTVEIYATEYRILWNRAQNFTSIVSPESRAKAKTIMGKAKIENG